MALEDKVTAVVLAGGNKKFSLKEFYYQLEDLFYYWEWYFRRGYKSLKRMKVGDAEEAKPMLEYILNTLDHVERIDKILVVGPEEEINKKVSSYFLENNKIKIIEQTDSFGGNAKKGYEEAGKDHVLFVVSDSPTTTSKDVNEFIDIYDKLENQYDIVYPVVKEALLKKHLKLFPRLCFKVLPDTIFPEDYMNKDDMREDGRFGIRISSMTFANLDGLSVEKINEAYELRKVLRKSSRNRLKEIFKNNIIKRYRAGLKLSEIQDMFSGYMNKTIKFIGLSGAGTSLDIDSKRDEKGFNSLLL